MLKQEEKVTKKEKWQHRSESAVVQGRFGSRQVSVAVWSTHTTGRSGPVVIGVPWKVRRPRLCLSEPHFPVYKMGPMFLAVREAQFTAV